mgnify:CR=1 FL=1
MRFVAVLVLLTAMTAFVTMAVAIAFSVMTVFVPMVVLRFLVTAFSILMRVAILGVLALIGMIAKNAVILIVSIEEERAAGRSVRDAVLGSATNRLRPMMLMLWQHGQGLVIMPARAIC